MTPNINKVEHMKRLLDWLNVAVGALSGIGNPQGIETVSRALAGPLRRRRRTPGDRER